MININPFIDKLEELKEYQNIWIDAYWDRKQFEIMFWRYFNDLGILLSPSLVTIELMSFDEFYKRRKAYNDIRKGAYERNKSLRSGDLSPFISLHPKR